MLKRFFLHIYVWVKYVFHTKLNLNKQTSSGNAGSSIQLSDQEEYGRRQRERFFELYNETYQDVIDYGPFLKDFQTNYAHLDDPEDKRFSRVTERVGLIYENDGKTPKNAAEVYDMTYQEYSDYKDTIIPIARERKITEEEIIEFLGK